MIIFQNKPHHVVYGVTASDTYYTTWSMFIKSFQSSIINKAMLTTTIYSIESRNAESLVLKEKILIEIGKYNLLKSHANWKQEGLY